MAKSSKPKKSPAKGVPLAVSANAAPDDAKPRITEPFANDFAAPGIDLKVKVETNVGTVRYQVTLTDSKPGATPVLVDIPAPNGPEFIAIFDGSHLEADKVYEIRVFVHPKDGDTPPNMDHAINVHTAKPPALTLVKSKPAAV